MHKGWFSDTQTCSQRLSHGRPPAVPRCCQDRARLNSTTSACSPSKGQEHRASQLHSVQAAFLSEAGKDRVTLLQVVYSFGNSLSLPYCAVLV